MLRFLVGVISIFVLLAVIIAFLIGREPVNRDDARQQANLINFIDTPAEVVFKQSGELVGEEAHDSVRITISRNLRQIEHIRGYDGRVLNTRTYPNTQPAFAHFMHALQIAGFTAQQRPGHDSHKGVCPFGRRFIYELVDGGQRVMHSWSTSCRAADGNFAGQADQVRRLFINQIPQYREFVRGLAI